MIFIKRFFYIFDYFVTLFHEMGHVVFGILLNRKIKKIIINSDLSGETHSSGKSNISLIISAWFGYPFPLLISLFLISIAIYNLSFMSIAIIINLIIMAIYARSLYTFLILSITIMFFFATFISSSITYKLSIYFIFSFFLILRSWKSLFNMTKSHIKNKKFHSDATILKKNTGINIKVWIFSFYFFFILLTLIIVTIVYANIQYILSLFL